MNYIMGERKKGEVVRVFFFFFFPDTLLVTSKELRKGRERLALLHSGLISGAQGSQASSYRQQSNSSEFITCSKEYDIQVQKI